ncbi:hypothetical protein O0L34_g18414 [Tuta absoluta]|nr:hypothetical protein O0L34_g18414 [Tuta absoluta]
MEAASSNMVNKSNDAIYCAGCTNTISDRRYLTCSYCKSVYDLECANVSEKRFYNTMQPQHKCNWKCPECITKKPKTGNVGLALNYSNALFDDSYSYEIVTIRNHLKGDRNGETPGSSTTVTIEETSLLDLPNEENCNYSDYLRCIIREELHEQSLVEILANSIAKIVTEQTHTRMQNTIQILTNEISKLQTKLTAMEILLQEKEHTNINLHVESSQPSSANAARTSSQQEVKQLPRTSTNDNIKLPLPKKANSNKKNKAKNTQNSTIPIIPAFPSQHVHSTQTPSQITQAVNAASHDSKHQSVDDPISADGEWIEVTRQRQRKIPPAKNKALYGSATPGTTALQASERMPYLHLCYVKEGTTVDQVRHHLNTVCGHEECTVVALKARGNYTSFKLSVPDRSLEKILSAESWPENICIEPWQQFFRVQKYKPKEK